MSPGPSDAAGRPRTRLYSIRSRSQQDLRRHKELRPGSEFGRGFAVGFAPFGGTFCQLRQESSTICQPAIAYPFGEEGWNVPLVKPYIRIACIYGGGKIARTS